MVPSSEALKRRLSWCTRIARMGPRCPVRLCCSAWTARNACRKHDISFVSPDVFAKDEQETTIESRAVKGQVKSVQ